MKRLEQVLKALADSNRLRILKMLERQPLCVCQVAYVLGVTQPAVSRHLKKLMAAGLVQCEQDGFWTNYFIDTTNEYGRELIRQIRGWLSEDAIVREDARRLITADRTRVCKS